MLTDMQVDIIIAILVFAAFGGAVFLSLFGVDMFTRLQRTYHWWRAGYSLRFAWWRSGVRDVV